MNATQDYAGFWRRAVATLIDWLWLYGIIYSFLIFVVGYGSGYNMIHFSFEWILPFLLVIGFWVYKQATPGKMLFKMRIVDAKTYGRVPPIRLVVRYLAYFFSMIPLFAGLIWVAFDKRKQGWHDKIAGTVIVRS